MFTDFDQLSRELTRAQLLLRASHELYEEILVEISRYRQRAASDLRQTQRPVPLHHRAR